MPRIRSNIFGDPFVAGDSPDDLEPCWPGVREAGRAAGRPRMDYVEGARTVTDNERAPGHDPQFEIQIGDSTGFRIQRADLGENAAPVKGTGPGDVPARQHLPKPLRWSSQPLLPGAPLEGQQMALAIHLDHSSGCESCL